MGFRERYLNRTMALELAPVAAFFVANWFWGLMIATAVVMVATLVCVVLGWRLAGRTPVLGIVTVVLVLVMGGLSLIFDDAFFIEIKPTIGKLLFAVALLAGMHLRPTLLERALGTLVLLTEQGWRVLHWRWIGLALLWAGANEIARHTLSSDDWVTFVIIMKVASIAAYILVTRLTAPAYWAGPRDS